MSKQIVPEGLIRGWSAQWVNDDPVDTLPEHIANRAAQWALEQAVTAAHKVAHEKFVYETYTQDMADAMEGAIRALMQGEGNGQG